MRSRVLYEQELSPMYSSLLREGLVSVRLAPSLFPFRIQGEHTIFNLAYPRAYFLGIPPRNHVFFRNHS